MAPKTDVIEQLRAHIAELEEENARLSDGAVCGDCDGSGWIENRVEGRYPCTCMTEAEPYQLLTEQLAAVQEECEFQRNAHKQAEELMLEQSTQLAAEQLNNKLLREHLRKLIEFELLDAGALSTDELCAEFRQAVIAYNATQASTEALDKYVAEKVKEATTGHVEDIRFKNKEIEELRRIKMARFNNEDCWIYQGDGEDHLESLSCPVVVYPSVLIELTKQRDLAVEALEYHQQQTRPIAKTQEALDFLRK